MVYVLGYDTNVFNVPLLTYMVVLLSGSSIAGFILSLASI
jgi:hypothetical protein